VRLYVLVFATVLCGTAACQAGEFYARFGNGGNGQYGYGGGSPYGAPPGGGFQSTCPTCPGYVPPTSTYGVPPPMYANGGGYRNGGSTYSSPPPPNVYESRLPMYANGGGYGGYQQTAAPPTQYYGGGGFAPPPPRRTYYELRRYGRFGRARVIVRFYSD